MCIHKMYIYIILRIVYYNVLVHILILLSVMSKPNDAACRGMSSSSFQLVSCDLSTSWNAAKRRRTKRCDQRAECVHDSKLAIEDVFKFESNMQMIASVQLHALTPTRSTPFFSRVDTVLCTCLASVILNVESYFDSHFDTRSSSMCVREKYEIVKEWVVSVWAAYNDVQCAVGERSLDMKKELHLFEMEGGCRMLVQCAINACGAKNLFVCRCSAAVSSSSAAEWTVAGTCMRAIEGSRTCQRTCLSQLSVFLQGHSWRNETRPDAGKRGDTECSLSHRKFSTSLFLRRLRNHATGQRATPAIVCEQNIMHLPDLDYGVRVLAVANAHLPEYTMYLDNCDMDQEIRRVIQQIPEHHKAVYFESAMNVSLGECERMTFLLGPHHVLLKHAFFKRVNAIRECFETS